jgi:hypothetical protein
MNDRPNPKSSAAPMKYNTVVVPCYEKASVRMNEGLVEDSQTLHRQRQEISTCFGCFLAHISLMFDFLIMIHTLAHSSISISPAVVSIITRPLVGRAISVRRLFVVDDVVEG